MSEDFAAAMRRVLDATRAGDPAGATAIIQTALNQTTGPRPTARQRQTLGKTVAGLAARRPVRPARPVAIPDGAALTRDVFACAAGSREYRLYVPASAAAGAEGLVMMLHGCTQSPDDFALGTGMDAVAEAHRLIVVYPGQSRAANAQSCWNWFSPADQRRDGGEPAILAGLAARLQAEHRVDRTRTCAAGLSAGAAMAVILGQTHPEVFGVVAAHSGLAYAAASDVASAFSAMRGAGPARPRRAPAQPVRTLVIHGAADATVAPDNGVRIAAEALAGLAGVVTETAEDASFGGRQARRVVSANAAGQAQVETWSIDGLGHAWSGGKSGGSYADPAGPDASALVARFLLSRA